MIYKKLKQLFTRQANGLVGNKLPAIPAKISECYSKLDSTHRWQGDVYPAAAFSANDLPNDKVPYWMIINRTCHLYEGGDRKPKLPYLNYAAVYPLHNFVEAGNKNIKNIISNIVNGKIESSVFLPHNLTYSVDTALVVNFNLIHTLSIDKCPSAHDKCIQLSSPFCEHVFQKFSRYFYTVGYDDTCFRTDSFIQELITHLQM